MLLVGIDWADAEHVYCMMDEAGAPLASGSIPHTITPAVTEDARC